MSLGCGSLASSARVVTGFSTGACDILSEICDSVSACQANRVLESDPANGGTPLPLLGVVARMLSPKPVASLEGAKPHEVFGVVRGLFGLRDDDSVESHLGVVRCVVGLRDGPLGADFGQGLPR